MTDFERVGGKVSPKKRVGITVSIPFFATMKRDLSRRRMI